ncbi:hypothetical protein PA0458 [Candidatus Phytoplasma australiense]|uniref:Uncharacterized protein n=1 Tax=Phytoplasma australiense TaxID=59748 RepID=B1VA20_PHYAS|nr:hypothetical protein PA0458 [Candidatus Phytoplasma australiense]
MDQHFVLYMQLLPSQNDYNTDLSQRKPWHPPQRAVLSQNFHRLIKNNHFQQGFFYAYDKKDVQKAKQLFQTAFAETKADIDKLPTESKNLTIYFDEEVIEKINNLQRKLGQSSPNQGQNFISIDNNNYLNVIDQIVLNVNDCFWLVVLL